jgi:tetratricopeptide (TPR) repeat protein
MPRKQIDPRLLEYYQEYLDTEDQSAFVAEVRAHYEVATLERLLAAESRYVRRAAAAALGFVGDYSSNAALGKALNDSDRGVRTLADHNIRLLWCRIGSVAQQHELSKIVRLNISQRFKEAYSRSSRIIATSPWIAESWNQRAIASFCLGRWERSLEDCQQALELNPYHFGAASGLGQCYMQLGDHPKALEAFRRALKLNPGLEGVRANVIYLQKRLKS